MNAAIQRTFAQSISYQRRGDPTFTAVSLILDGGIEAESAEHPAFLSAFGLLADFDYPPESGDSVIVGSDHYKVMSVERDQEPGATGVTLTLSKQSWTSST